MDAVTAALVGSGVGLVAAFGGVLTGQHMALNCAADVRLGLSEDG